MKKSKQQFFDGLAMKWEEMFYRNQRQSAALDELAAGFGISSGSRVLDVGCGTGVVLERLSAAAGRRGLVVGCDFSLTMLACAREKGKKNCRFICSDAQAMALRNGSFDCAVYFSCFPHFDDKKKALKEAARLLKPGGVLIISHLLSRSQIAGVHAAAGKAVCSDTLPSRQWFRSALPEAGFSLEVFIDRPGLSHLKAIKNK